MMKTDRNLSTKTESKSAEKSAAVNNRSRSYLIGAAILAIFVFHFAWQFSFVQRENWRVAKDSMQNSPPEIISGKSQSGDQPVEMPTDLAAKPIKVEKEARTVLPVKFSPPENKLPPETKKKMPVESKSARLRRAEKLLTGF